MCYNLDFMQVTGTGPQQTRRQTPQQDDRIFYIRHADAQDYVRNGRIHTAYGIRRDYLDHLNYGSLGLFRLPK